MEWGGLCQALGEQCCFYTNILGIIRNITGRFILRSCSLVTSLGPTTKAKEVDMGGGAGRGNRIYVCAHREKREERGEKGREVRIGVRRSNETKMSGLYKEEPLDLLAERQPSPCAGKIRVGAGYAR